MTQSPKIVSIGELLVDLTQTAICPDLIRCFAANPGGAPANVAVAAARLGQSVAFIGKVGKDAFGADLRETLRRNGIATEGLFESANAPTTLAVVSVDHTGDRSFSFYRNPGADTLLTPEEVTAALDALPEKPGFLHIGSVSMTQEPSRSATLAAAQYGKAQGIPVSYDPNYRASLWPDEAEAIRQMKSLLPFTSVLKISLEELPLLTGTGDLHAGSLILQEYGIPLVLITLGPDGAFYRLGARTGQLPGIAVTVADTNGAGDTFLGALLHRLLSRGSTPPDRLRQEELEEDIAFAIGAAALTCSRSGSIPAMPTLNEVEAMLGSSGETAAPATPFHVC